MAKLELPRDVQKGDQVRTVETAADYWNFLARGFEPVPLTPAQKAAATRARNKAEDQDDAEATSNVPDSATDPAGTAV